MRQVHPSGDDEWEGYTLADMQADIERGEAERVGRALLWLGDKLMAIVNAARLREKRRRLPFKSQKHLPRNHF